MVLVPLPQTWDLKPASGWKTLSVFSLQFVGDSESQGLQSCLEGLTRGSLVLQGALGMIP